MGNYVMKFPVNFRLRGELCVGDMQKSIWKRVSDERVIELSFTQG